MTEAQLAGAYQCTHNGQYFGELYTRYYENVYAYCLRFTHDREGALDIAQEAFLRAAERIAQLRSPRLFAGWLFRIVRNECIDYLKDRNENVPLAQAESTLNDKNGGPFSLSPAEEKEQLLNALQAALKEADESSRALLKEKYFEGLPISELQQRYGLSESAVKMRLARARKHIRARIKYIAACDRQQVA